MLSFQFFFLHLVPVFGAELGAQFRPAEKPAPTIVMKCVQAMERGVSLRTVGIYSIVPSGSGKNALKTALNQSKSWMVVGVEFPISNFQLPPTATLQCPHFGPGGQSSQAYFRLWVVPLWLSPSCVTRKKTARRCDAHETRDLVPFSFMPPGIRAAIFLSQFSSRHARRTKRKSDYP